jgi:hypothetical protein
MPESKVYILGAGCSKDCGYPLGPEMKEDLERFGQSLDPTTSPRLIQAINDTVRLMSGTTETTDILVQKLYGGHLDQQIGGEQNRQAFVFSATLATSAALLAKEAAAKRTGFKRYREFISDLFPGAETRWPLMPPTKDRHVLTFNYDRMFEIAFLDRFQIKPYGLYDIKVLNSGVTLPGVQIEFEPENLSFLKLHGSVGAWTIDFTGMGHPAHQRCYFETPLLNQPITVNDAYFFDAQHPGHIKRPPVIYFPFQRQTIVSSQTGFAFHRYARDVWARASHLVSKATEIHVIGYSFSGIDRGPMIQLLETATGCERLIIQSPDADRICKKLALDRPKLRSLIESASYPF